VVVSARARSVRHARFARSVGCAAVFGRLRVPAEAPAPARSVTPAPRPRYGAFLLFTLCLLPFTRYGAATRNPRSAEVCSRRVCSVRYQRNARSVAAPPGRTPFCFAYFPRSSFVPLVRATRPKVFPLQGKTFRGWMNPIAIRRRWRDGGMGPGPADRREG
jgi:hypothetical protein